MLGVPMTVGGGLIGVLHLDWRSIHPRGEREVHLLELVADRASLAISNAQLFEEERESGRLSEALNRINSALSR